jgi:Tfp pilus assembly protein PilN
MRAVNLLPDPGAERREGESQSNAGVNKRIGLAGGAALVLTAVVFGFAFTQARSTASDRQATLDGLQAKVARTQAAAAVTAAAAARTHAHLAAVTSAASGRTAWDDLLGQLSRVMPRGAWLDTLDATAAGAAATSTAAASTPSTGSASVTTNGLSSSASGTPAAGGATLTVTGFARSQAIVPSVIARLALIPTLSNVSLQVTQRADVGSKKAAQFTINANVGPGGIG